MATQSLTEVKNLKVEYYSRQVNLSDSKKILQLKIQ